MSTSLSLDALVVIKILLFTDIRTDWNLLSCLPCFISKTFEQVFSSEGFAKEYVIMLFKLDRDLEKQLENCIKTHNTIVGERNRMTFQKILHEYKKCCNALAKAKRDALENLENFGELNDDDQERSLEKATMELGNAMKTFFEHSLRLDYLCEPSMIIPRDELKTFCCTNGCN
ncbi:hypothetical protein C9374_003452 [Naegleria lovaniensis]|uniref:Uncharacterized protein n=1 Tax=Naegleria lovaniensis TaxID=51637 RepID=A0AA88GRD6_NAELO|nr:uncharacterized protein C9374_003452 [Naegleria lovaniensis]KAG2385637.1 hypothetical protein C9374_003452 [Naegleria lovaniensis]